MKLKKEIMDNFNNIEKNFDKLEEKNLEEN